MNVLARQEAGCRHSRNLFTPHTVEKGTTAGRGIIETVKTQEIQQALAQIEQADGVRVLFAVESGSRAWGFASPDSDYDIRFVYARAIPEYVRIDPPRDVIERPLVGDLDVSGWDLLKALHLFRQSNPALLEWLHSPIVYSQSGELMPALREMAKRTFSPRRTAYHYVSMARSNWESYLKDRERVTLKKYLYAIRPLCAFAWVERHGTPPPTAFAEVRGGIELASDFEEQLTILLARKQEAREAEPSAPNLELNGWISAELERAQQICPQLPDNRTEAKELNALAWRVLNEETTQ
jgi:uncharacterized protein